MAQGGRGSKTAKGKAKAKSAGSGCRAMSIPQQAMQKIRENMAGLPDECKFVKTLEGTGRTLKEQVEHDIILKKKGDRLVLFGPTYYSDRMKEYSPDGSAYSLLKPNPTDESIVNADLVAAIP